MTEKAPTVSAVLLTYKQAHLVGREIQSMLGRYRLPGVGAIL